MCQTGDWDGDWYAFPGEIRTTRRERQCGECSRPIAVGENYERVRNRSDGQYGAPIITCAHCLVARQWLSDICNGWLYGGVHEDLREHWDEEWALRSVTLGRYVILMQTRWHRHGQLVPVPPRVRWDHETGKPRQAQEAAA